MKVGDVMARGVHTCHLDDSMHAVHRSYWGGDCVAVAVVDADGKAVAMITDSRHLHGGVHARPSGRPIGIVSMNDLARNATSMGRSGDA